MAAKNSAMNLMETPRKVPFKDATNKALELLKSAMKATNSEQLDFTPPAQTGQKQMKEVQGAPADDFDVDIDEFKFPADSNCFCCGNNRKSKFHSSISVGFSRIVVNFS